MASVVTAYGGINNVETDDVVQGLYKWFLEKTDLMALLGHLPGLEPYTPLMFQNTMQVVIEGEQTNALVIKYAGGWGSPNSFNTLKFPRIGLEFYCDPLRDELNQVIEDNETIRRIQYIYEKFDKYMHRPASLEDVDSSPSGEGKIEMWGSVRTIECVRLGEFSFNPVPDGDGMFLGTVYYGVTLG